MTDFAFSRNAAAVQQDALRNPGIAHVVIKYRFGDDRADFIEMWGEGVRMPSVLLTDGGDTENSGNNLLRGFKSIGIDLGFLHIGHNAVKKVLLKLRRFFRSVAVCLENAQHEPEHRCIGKVERLKAWYFGIRHNSVSVVGLDNLNEVRAPTESQGPVGVCPLRPQGDFDA